MNRSIALFPALGALLTLAAGARAADLVDRHAIKAQVPQTATARKWAAIGARARGVRAPAQARHGAGA